MRLQILTGILFKKTGKEFRIILKEKSLYEESSNGLWYYIKKEGTGKYFTDNDKISIDYVCSLLDGTECYSSDKLGPKEFILARVRLKPT